METVSTEFHERRPLGVAVVRIVLSVIWTAIRLPVVTVLVILEPFVTTIMIGIALLGLFMCLFNGLLLKDPHFPLWLMLGLSIGSALILLPYYALIRLLSGRSP